MNQALEQAEKVKAEHLDKIAAEREPPTKGIPEGPNSDLDIFLPDPRTLKDKNGNEFQTVPLSWGVEAKILSKVGSLLGRLAGSYSDGVVAIEDVKGDLIASIVDAPELLTELVMALTDKPKSWVEDSLTSDQVMEVVVPFLKRNWQRWAKTIKHFAPNLIENIPGVQASPKS